MRIDSRLLAVSAASTLQPSLDLLDMALQISKPLLRWRVPRALVLELRPQKTYSGWSQFRISIYFFLGGMIIWGMDQFNPKFADDPPSLLLGINLSFLGGAIIAYGLPLLNNWSPSFVAIYPNYLAINQGMLTRRAVFLGGQYSFKRSALGWILILVGLDGTETAVGIPSDDLQLQVAAALSDIKVFGSHFSSDEIEEQRQARDALVSRINTYRTASRAFYRFWLPSILGFYLAGMLALLGVVLLIKFHYWSLFRIPVWILDFVAGVAFIAFLVYDNRSLRSRALAAGLTCASCGKSLVTPEAQRNLYLNGTCRYCQSPFAAS